MGVALLVALPALGTTFAPKVTLGADLPVEFGQGSQVLVACDDSIIVELGSAWYPTGAYFRVSAVTLKSLDTTSGGCAGKTLAVRLLDTSGIAIAVTTAADTALTHSVPSAGPGDANDSVTLPLDTAVNIDSIDVARVTVETSSTP